MAAMVNRRKEGYFITPAGGMELKVNGKIIDRRCDLKDGDLVEVASLKLQFYLKDNRHDSPIPKKDHPARAGRSILSENVGRRLKKIPGRETWSGFI